MAYTKTTWKNNVTDIDENNLNKIEQGIYDNSLATDIIKPTGETYKSQTITEGQITDVIGVSDIVIKGQTSQNGEPTPSSPVDVNVVSGSNVINIGNKNLFDSSIITTKTTNGITAKLENEEIVITGTATADAHIAWGYTLNGKLLGKTLTLSYTGNFSSSNLANIGFKKNLQDRIVLNRTTENVTFEVTQTLINDVNQFAIYYKSGSVVNARIKIQLEQNSTATTYEPHQGKELPLDLGSIELCKIGNYQDYFYKSGSKWYLHKEIGKVVLDGNENWEQYSGNNNVFFAVINSSIMPLPKNESLNVFCDNYVSVLSTSSVTTFIDEASNLSYAIGVHVTSSVIRIKDTRYTSVTDLKTWLASNNVTVYYVLATPTNTEITNTTLISQLEAIYNAPLYEQTNITQTNNDLPMVLDITACKDNINGIKAWIRR